MLGAFRGIAVLSALTLAAEIGDIRRFAHPRQLMAYLGLVPSEHSSGERTKRGAITKAGNVHARKAIVSAAWKYAARPTRSHPLKKRQALLPPTQGARNQLESPTSTNDSMPWRSENPAPLQTLRLHVNSLAFFGLRCSLIQLFEFGERAGHDWRIHGSSVR